MNTILAIDPGMTTGIVWGRFDATTPFIREGFAEVPGGLEGFADWCSGVHMRHIVCERFRARPHARSYRQNELEPLRIEGYVYATFPQVTFQWPEQRGWGRAGVAGAEAVLRAKNLWLLPSDISNHSDADDVNAAQMHLLAYLRNIGHAPTIEAYLI